MAKKASIYAAIVVLVLCALYAGGYWLMHRRSTELCSICQRHIKPEAHVVVEIGSHRRDVCCAHCALTEGRQENKPVRFIQVTDYRTGKGLDPQRAWFVDGSRVVACEHDMAKMDEMKQMDQMSFDRCSPGTFAFADRNAAEAFVTENGGVVHNLAEMVRGIQ
jgi:nitrous oxide reductase accessory protein NosL